MTKKFSTSVDVAVLSNVYITTLICKGYKEEKMMKENESQK